MEFIQKEILMKKLYEILIPTIKNERPIRTRYHKVWDKFVKEITGGLTVLRPAKGVWVSPSKKTVEERMIPVRVCCTPEQLDEILLFSLTYYAQEVMMAYEISNNVIFKDNKNAL